MPRSSSILSRAINCCWFVFKWAVAICLVAGGVAAYCLYHQVDEKIRYGLEARLAQHYNPKGLKVSVRSAQLVEGKGIRVRDLSIVEPGIEGRAGSVARRGDAVRVPDRLEGIDRRGFAGAAGNGPTADASHYAAARWRVERGPAVAPPNLSKHPPEVTWENGVVELFDPTSAPPPHWCFETSALRSIQRPTRR